MDNSTNALLFIIVLILLFGSTKEATTSGTSLPTDVASLVNPSVIFNANNMYTSGTSITTEYVRIFKQNGEEKDLGYKSVNAGSLQLSPNEKYKFYFFMNTSPSLNYYVDVQEYTGKVQDSVDNVIGQGCAVDNSLTYATLDDKGRVQANGTNVIDMSTNTKKDIALRIKSHMGKCYGNPDAPEGKGNVICIDYTAGIGLSFSANTALVQTPSSIASNLTGSGVCFQFPILENGAGIDLPLSINSGSTEITSDHNMTVWADDLGFDINADDKSEIWGYTDEDGNRLGSIPIKLGTIRVS